MNENDKATNNRLISNKLLKEYIHLSNYTKETLAFTMSYLHILGKKIENS